MTNSILVGKEGFEPSHPCGYYALNVARLPFRHLPSCILGASLPIKLSARFDVPLVHLAESVGRNDDGVNVDTTNARGCHVAVSWLIQENGRERCIHCRGYFTIQTLSFIHVAERARLFNRFIHIAIGVL